MSEAVEQRFYGGPNLYGDDSLLRVALPNETGAWGSAPPALQQNRLSAFGPALKDRIEAVPAVRTWVEWLAEFYGAGIAPLLLKPRRSSVAQGQDGAYVLLLPCETPDAGIAHLSLAVATVRWLRGEDRVRAALKQVLASVDRLGSDPLYNQSSWAITKALHARGIPWQRRDLQSRTLFYGEGAAGRLALETMLEPEGAFGLRNSVDKVATNAQLAMASMPVLPSGIATSEERALAVARKIGAPVVVKPVRGTKGIGVTLDVRTREGILAAFREAGGPAMPVMVEKFAQGEDYRVLVVGGRMIAAARRDRASVTGDGERTIRDLLDELNADPRRGRGFDALMNLIEPDERMRRLLQQQGHTLDSVPGNDERVVLTLAANIAQGGTAVDVTAHCHPDNRAMFERAARLLDFGIVGIDYLSTDISRPFREVGGHILEVNVPPGLRPHWIGNPAQDVVAPIVERSFPQGATGRIPTAGVTGSWGKTTTCQMLAAIARKAGRHPALCTTQGAWSGDYFIGGGDAAGGRVARELLADRAVDCGVFELARGGLLDRGLMLDSVKVGAVLNVGDNHVGFDGLDTVEAVAGVKAIVARGAREWLFLNAADPRVLAMRELARKGCHVALVAYDPSTPALVAAREAGECTVTLAGDGKGRRIVMQEGDQVLLELPLAAIPAASPATDARAIAENAMFAAGMAVKMGLPAEAIAEALGEFTSDAAQNPGRHNSLDGLPFEVRLHFSDGEVPYADWVEALHWAKRKGSTRHVLAMVLGNRDDAYIAAQVRTLAGRFDHYHLADLWDLRGREPGAVPQIMAAELRKAGVPEAAITLHEGPDPVAEVFDAATAGDRVAINGYRIDEHLPPLDRWRA